MSNRKTALTRANFGFLLAKASQRWNEELAEGFAAAGFADVRPAYGSILIPLFEEDGLRLGELALRGGIAKQTMTTMVREVEAAGLVRRRPDPADARATRVYLTAEAQRFAPAAERVLAAIDRRAAALEGYAEMQRVAAWLRRYARI
jgi:DNA-binding MarR family transcriptional regulator